MTALPSGRVGAVQGPQHAATGPEPSSGVGPALHLDGPEPPVRSYLELGAQPHVARTHDQELVSVLGAQREPHPLAVLTLSMRRRHGPGSQDDPAGLDPLDSDHALNREPVRAAGQPRAVQLLAGGHPPDCRHPSVGPAAENDLALIRRLAGSRTDYRHDPQPHPAARASERKPLSELVHRGHW